MAANTVLEQALRSREGLEGLEIHEVKEVPCTKPGDNFMSVVGLLEIHGTLPGGRPYNDTVFAKRQLGSTEVTQLLQTDVAFHNEVVMYNDVMPSYDVSVPFPQCLHASGEVIYLENLKAAGYTMANRQMGFGLVEASLILKALARFHVGSYHPLRVKNEKFIAGISKLKPIGFMLTSQKELTELALRKSVRQLQGQGIEEVLSFMQGLEGHFGACLKALRKPKDIKTLCHGDFWLNNILIREGEDPVRIVDFQACSVLSPAVDVWSFLYSSIQPSIMESAFPHLLQTYSTAFMQELATQRVPSALSAKHLMVELESRELYGYIVGMMYVTALLMDQENVPDFENLPKEVLLDDSLMDQYMNSNIRERISHLSRFGIGRGLFKKKPVIDSFG